MAVRTYSLQHCVKVLMSLVHEENEVVSDFHLKDLVGVLLLELHDQWTACVLDEPEIMIMIWKITQILRICLCV